MAKGKITPDLLKKIKDSVNIIEVIGEHVVLRKSGSNFTGLCPFHAERTPSFSVSEQKQLYHCYGCKKGGDLVSFVMDILGISFPEAIEDLALRAKVALPKDWSSESSDDPETSKRKAAAKEKIDVLYRLNRFAGAFFRHSLDSSTYIKEYFHNRGATSDLMRNFYVGAAPASWDALSRHLIAKKAPLPLAVELGLIRHSPANAKPGGCGYFDLFRNRAMFPILDLRGRISGFGGRAMAGAGVEAGNEGPKYLNSPESIAFQKSKLAFGLFQAQKHIREFDHVILVEGYFDALALHAAGFRNVVASCGTALSPEHLAIFRRLCSKIIVLFDGDKAGVTATDRAMETGLKHGMVIWGAEMPAGFDPDELLYDQKTGKEKPEGSIKMKAVLEAARPLLDKRIEEILVTARKSPEFKAQAVKRIAGWLGDYSDPVGREVRLDALREQGISRQILNSALSFGQNSRTKNNGKASISNGKNSERKTVSRTDRFTTREKILLAAFVKWSVFGVEFDEIGDKLPPGATLGDLFEYQPARDFVASILMDTSVRVVFEKNPSAFLGNVIDEQVRSTLSEALFKEEAGFNNRELRLALARTAGRIWARFSQQIKIAMAQAEANKDAGLHSKLMKEYLDVQRKMKEFNSFYDEA